MAARTRIALLITELRPAGAERVVLDLATGLDPGRFEVKVFSLTSPGTGDGAVADLLRSAGVAVEPIRMGHKLDLFGARRLVSGLRDFAPDLLNAHLFHANLAARLLGRRGGARRVVSTVHVVERRPLRLRRLLERLSAGRDDRTVCVSAAVARHAVAELGVRDPLVIHNGVDLERFRELPDRRAALERLGIPDTDGAGPVLGAVGRLTAQKGFDDLLRAFRALDVPDPARPPRLVLAGAGEDARALGDLARQLRVEDRVHFVGHQSDVRDVLAALDVLCMPSRWEGFGLALVEALAAGVPAVATAVDSLPEVAGEAAVLVPPGSPEELARGIGRVLAEPGLAARLRRRGPVQAARFSVDAMVAKYAALYTELCRAGG